MTNRHVTCLNVVFELDSIVVLNLAQMESRWPYVDVKKPETSLTGRPLFNFSGEISDFDNLRKRVFFSKSPQNESNSLKNSNG